MGTHKHIHFSKTIGTQFESTLQERVKAYFKENQISRYGNLNMLLKTIFMLCLYFIPYLLFITGTVTNTWGIILCWVLIGFGMAGIGMSIIHDANHGSYSKNKLINTFLGRVMNIVGTYAPNWKIQHNVLHHTYTNIEGHDEDISPGANLLRLNKKNNRLPIHKYQIIYAWFLYSLMTITWVSVKDFFQLFRYKKMGLTQTKNFFKLLVELFVSKAFYYTYIFILPVLILDIPWYAIIGLLLIKHFVCGFTLAIVFILAHIVPETAFPEPINSKIDNNWSIHQLETTCNFSPKSNIFSWFIGGLNYQIEHHLFPQICHVHYKNISTIVRKTAEEFGLPYYCEKTFLSAVRGHARLLYNLGKK
jgi:linoleoyl-CoA desaturase